MAFIFSVWLNTDNITTLIEYFYYGISHIFSLWYWIFYWHSFFSVWLNTDNIILLNLQIIHLLYTFLIDLNFFENCVLKLREWFLSYIFAKIFCLFMLSLQKMKTLYVYWFLHIEICLYLNFFKRMSMMRS